MQIHLIYLLTNVCFKRQFNILPWFCILLHILVHSLGMFSLILLNKPGVRGRMGRWACFWPWQKWLSVSDSEQMTCHMWDSSKLRDWGYHSLSPRTAGKMILRQGLFHLSSSCLGLTCSRKIMKTWYGFYSPVNNWSFCMEDRCFYHLNFIFDVGRGGETGTGGRWGLGV